MKKTASILLALTLAATGATGAYAQGDGPSRTMPALDEIGHFKFNGHFHDVTKGDWAIRYITEMNTKGVIKGDGYGQFRPSANVSHEEAITMTVRLMGLEEEARAITDIDLDLNDEAKVSAWAKAYIALAQEKGFLDTGITLDPQGHADREWITRLVVRAMGLEAEAKAHMTDKLDFKDAKEIEADYVGYIAVAAEQGIINGYLDHTFQPNKPVKRNELAAILARAENRFEYDRDRQRQSQGQLHGTLTAVSDTSLTFRTPTGATATYKLSGSYYVFLGEKIAQLADLKTGMGVRVLLNAQGQIVFIQAQPQAPKREEIATHAFGTVTAYTAPKADAAGMITIAQPAKKHPTEDKDKQPRTLTLSVAADVKILHNGEVDVLKQTVTVNDRVELLIVNNTVLEVDVLPALLKQPE
ncbi:S-layer homology domain-containing protein [Tumebacillus sp. DT12]|uniref:S-layer homology domain-containing protein n=1 Tax=Tumebacillus lacus TaxID=2995335 RepID=A0ABT3WZ49_9BACL|nr:S-layer homology domain-containing protein [Tumebacillus lacus]MCX7569037.1 S-layer homology domain-containing protein [Tumebacillus lacus]